MIGTAPEKAAGRLWGLVPVVGGRGPEFAKSEAMRYLAEIPWAPHAIIGNRELEWRQLDDASVEVATQVDSARAAVRLHFDAAGDITGTSADARPRMQGKRTIETPWNGRFGDYQEFQGCGCRRRPRCFGNSRTVPLPTSAPG